MFKMSIKTKNKKTRSRSPEKKAAQFQRILEAGKDLFLEKGRDGFSLRGLAKNLGMNQNNLYNYVDSKRELWIAIRNNARDQLKPGDYEGLRLSTDGTISEGFSSNFYAVKDGVLRTAEDDILFGVCHHTLVFFVSLLKPFDFVPLFIGGHGAPLVIDEFL